jgi:hypothetical protein
MEDIPFCTRNNTVDDLSDQVVAASALEGSGLLLPGSLVRSFVQPFCSGPIKICAVADRT